MLLIYSFDRRSLNVLLHGPKKQEHMPTFTLNMLVLMSRGGP